MAMAVFHIELTRMHICLREIGVALLRLVSEVAHGLHGIETGSCRLRRLRRRIQERLRRLVGEQPARRVIQIARSRCHLATRVERREQIRQCGIKGQRIVRDRDDAVRGRLHLVALVQEDVGSILVPAVRCARIGKAVRNRIGLVG